MRRQQWDDLLRGCGHEGGGVYDGAGKLVCSGRSEAKGMDIADWRKKIDEMDEQIVRLISQRAEAAKAIGELKRQTQLPVYEPQREQAVFKHVRAVNPGPLADGDMLHVYERIIDVMRTLQRRQE
jgi:chorismate mutase